MFYDNENYTLRIEEVAGAMHYYISFMDEQKGFHETEVSAEVYAEFLQFEKDERNRW